jgi:hypothetical protein
MLGKTRGGRGREIHHVYLGVDGGVGGGVGGGSGGVVVGGGSSGGLTPPKRETQHTRKVSAVSAITVTAHILLNYNH